MIQGVVNSAYEPIVSITVQGPGGQAREIEAVIDTGFSEFLTLPPALVAELRLLPVTSASAILANGSEVIFDVCRGTVLWDGHPRHIDVYVSDATPLVGMRLLDRHNLSIQVRAGGRVVIQAGE
ncbi:MAG: clan AA aspartic protease [Chloroflexi bacterium]|nr:clan AA aspartic protease [Chloroflexota bacterium]